MFYGISMVYRAEYFMCTQDQWPFCCYVVDCSMYLCQVGLSRSFLALEKALMLGKIEDKRRRGWGRMRWLDGIINSVDKFEQTLEDSEGQGSLACSSPWGCKGSNKTLWPNWLFYPLMKMESWSLQLLLLNHLPYTLFLSVLFHVSYSSIFRCVCD